jgi:hypothetical protein
MLRLTCLIGLLAVLSMPASAPGQPRGQAGGAGDQDGTTAETVVAAYLEAIGGVDAVRAVESRRMTYWVHMFGRDAYLMEQVWTRPNSLRMGPPGADEYTLVEGEKAWRVGPEGRQELPANAAASLGRLADIDGPLVNPAEKNITLAYSGVVQYDMSELHQVTVTFGDGTQWEYFFDSRTGLLRKVTKPSYYMLNGETSRGPDTNTYYYDYRPVGSVLYPHYWIQATESHTHLFVVEEIENG